VTVRAAAERDGPLHGLKVLDLTAHMAGPFCTMILADMRAGVVKVERPGKGDSTRAWGDGSERNPYFRYINRNKKGITLDYKQPEGRVLFLRLVESIDALVENYRATVMPRAGLGVDALREINSQPSAFGSRETGCGSLRTLCRLAAKERVAFAALGESCPGIGARRLGQSQVRLGASHISHNQRFCDELHHLVGDLALRMANIGRHRRGRAKREASGKDRQAAQDRLLEVAEEPITPLERCVHALVARRCRTIADGQQSQGIILHSRGNAPYPDGIDARGRQLDR